MTKIYSCNKKVKQGILINVFMKLKLAERSYGCCRFRVASVSDCRGDAGPVAWIRYRCGRQRKYNKQRIDSRKYYTSHVSLYSLKTIQQTTWHNILGVFKGGDVLDMSVNSFFGNVWKCFRFFLEIFWFENKKSVSPLIRCDM